MASMKGGQNACVLEAHLPEVMMKRGRQTCEGDTRCWSGEDGTAGAPQARVCPHL